MTLSRPNIPNLARDAIRCGNARACLGLGALLAEPALEELTFSVRSSLRLDLQGPRIKWKNEKTKPRQYAP